MKSYYAIILILANLTTNFAQKEVIPPIASTISVDILKLIEAYENDRRNDSFNTANEISVLDSWLNSYLTAEKIYYLAQHDTALIDTVYGYLMEIEKELMVSPGGVLFNEVIPTGYEPTIDEITVLRDKMSKKIELNYSFWELPHKMCKTLRPWLISESKFNSLRTEQCAIEISKNVTLEYRYPNPVFIGLNDSILTAGKGSKNHYLLNSGRLIGIKIKEVRNTEDIPKDDELKQVLKDWHRMTTIEEFVSDIYCESEVEISSENCMKFHEVYKFNKSREIGKLNGEEFKSVGEIVLCSYKINNDEKFITIENFVKRYNKKTIKRNVASYADVVKLLKDFVFDELAYAKAIQLDLDENEDFAKKMNGIKKKLYSKEYLNSLFEEEINITDEDIVGYYERHNEEFVKTASAEITLFYFNSLNSALEAYHTNNLKEKTDLTDIGSLESENLKVSFLVPGKFGLKQVNKFMDVEEKTYSMPVFIEGIKYAIVYKNKNTGDGVIPLELAKDQIKRKLWTAKAAALKQEILTEIDRSITIANKEECRSALANLK